MVHLPLLGLLGLLQRNLLRVPPQALQVVEFPGLVHEDVDHHCGEVHKQPGAAPVALNVVDLLPVLLHGLLTGVGHGLDLGVGRGGAQHEVVAQGGQLLRLQHLLQYLLYLIHLELVLQLVAFYLILF